MSETSQNFGKKTKFRQVSLMKNGKKKEKADILEVYPDSAKKELEAIPEVYAILSDKERLDLASTIKDVSSSNMLNESYMSYKWANLMIDLVNKRFAQMQTKHFARYY